MVDGHHTAGSPVVSPPEEAPVEAGAGRIPVVSSVRVAGMGMPGLADTWSALVAGRWNSGRDTAWDHSWNGMDRSAEVVDRGAGEEDKFDMIREFGTGGGMGVKVVWWNTVERWVGICMRWSYLFEMDVRVEGVAKRMISFVMVGMWDLRTCAP